MHFLFRDTVSNGNVDDLSDADDNIEDGSDKDEEIDKDNEHDKDASVDDKLNISKPRSKSRSKLARQLKKKNKKSVQFADGIKPGEGTSPSGGEGDMPSPPPPTAINFRDELKDLKRDKIYSSRKSRKQEKRVRPPKAKKKVKVRSYCSLSFARDLEKQKFIEYFSIRASSSYYLKYLALFTGEDNQVEETAYYTVDGYDDGRFRRTGRSFAATAASWFSTASTSLAQLSVSLQHGGSSR